MINIAYLGEDDVTEVLEKVGGVKETIEDKISGVNVDIFQKPVDLVGSNWDGPLFTKKYDTIITGIMMLNTGTPIRNEESKDGRTTGIEILKKVIQDEGSINYGTPYLVVSSMRDELYLEELKKVMKWKSVGSKVSLPGQSYSFPKVDFYESYRKPEGIIDAYLKIPCTIANLTGSLFVILESAKFKEVLGNK